MSDKLRRAVMEAHQRAATQNPNLSSQVVAACGGAGVPFHQAVIGALATLGGHHGPAAQARQVIYRMPLEDVKAAIERGERIPGWGNSFYKDRLDPAWEEVNEILSVHHLDAMTPIAEISLRLGKAGKRLYPNAAAFTAAAAEVLGMPDGTELQLFVEGRIGAWARIWADAQRT